MKKIHFLLVVLFVTLIQLARGVEAALVIERPGAARLIPTSTRAISESGSN